MTVARHRRLLALPSGGWSGSWHTVSASQPLLQRTASPAQESQILVVVGFETIALYQ